MGGQREYEFYRAARGVLYNMSVKNCRATLSLLDEKALTEDDFLSGAIRLFQPVKGYRASSDSVLLAALTPLEQVKKVLELGVGYGQVLLCLLARQPALHVTGIDIREDVLALAEKNIYHNHFESQCRLICASVADRIRLEHENLGLFERIVCNPPYRHHRTHTASENAIKACATTESPDASLEVWLGTAASFLAPEGEFILIHDAQRKVEILATLQAAGFTFIQALPLASHKKGIIKRIVFRARKGDDSENSVRIEHQEPLVLHEDDGRWCAQIDAVLRAPLALDVWAP